jgi:hypothetical protein
MAHKRKWTPTDGHDGANMGDEPGNVSQSLPSMEEETEPADEEGAGNTVPFTVCTLTGRNYKMRIEPSVLLKCNTGTGYVSCIIPSGKSEHHERIKSELRDGTIAGRVANIVMRIKPWTVEFVWAIVHEYIRFLELKMEEPNPEVSRISPSPLIDEVWHLHILDTRNYAADCHQMHAEHFPRKAGQFIHHSPLGMFDNKKVLKQRREAAKKAYQLRFGTRPDEAYWGADAAPDLNYCACSCLNCAIAREIGTDPRQQRVLFRRMKILPGMTFADLHGPLENMVFHVVLKLAGC